MNDETKTDAPDRSEVVWKSRQHYRQTGISAIDVIEDWGAGFHVGNVIKYLARLERKDTEPVEDIAKAAWYLLRYVGLDLAADAVSTMIISEGKCRK